MGMGNFEGGSMRRHVQRHPTVTCAKTAEPIEMPLGCRLGWAEASMCYMVVHFAPPGEYD